MNDEILIASDHAGFELKRKLEQELKKRGVAVRDMGTNSSDSTDYPDFAHPVAKAVSSGKAKGGVLICGTGLGMSYVANRYPNVRAAVTWSPEVAELARSHNDANVLVLPARFVSDDDAMRILDRWMATPFEGGRHVRRVGKIEAARTSGSKAAKSPSRKAARSKGTKAAKAPGRKVAKSPSRKSAKSGKRR